MADTTVAGERVGFTPAWAARVSGRSFLIALPPRASAACCGCRSFSAPGSGVYFVLKFEPPLWPGVAATIAGAGLSFALRRHPAWCEAALALTVFAAGFALICETARERQAPMLQRHLGPVTVTGRVVDIDLAQKWLAHRRRAGSSCPGSTRTDQPHRLRLHIPQTSDELNPGDHVRLKAVLHPVPPQILPGGRDFQRELYFAGIGAVGYTFGGARRITGRGRRLRNRWRLARGSAASAHRDDAADQRRAAGLDRRGRFGADHRQTRRHRGRGQAVLPRFRPVASAGDRRAASRPRRRLCLLRRARRPGADSSGLPCAIRSRRSPPRRRFSC